MHTEFASVIWKSICHIIRAVRAKTNVCPSAMPGINVTKLLSEIVIKDIYKEDYNVLTSKLLEEKISYEDALTSVKSIAAGIGNVLRAICLTAGVRIREIFWVSIIFLMERKPGRF